VCKVRTCGSIVLIMYKSLGFLFIKVLAGVCSFIFQDLDKAVEAGCEYCTKGRTKPVNPVIRGKVV